MSEPTREQIIMALTDALHNTELDCDVDELRPILKNSIFLLTSDSARIAELEAEVARLKEERRWIPVSEKEPESEQRVITYNYHKPLDLDEYEMLTYYRKGDSLQDEMTYEEKTELFKGKTEVEMLIAILTAKKSRPAPEDGFYIYDSDSSGHCRWRKCINVTHWQPLPQPPEESEGSK